MHLSNTDVLFIYGFGSGEHYLECKSWLQEGQERYLIFIEEDEGVFFRFLNSSISADPQVRCFLITRQSEDEIFKKIAWDFVFLRFSYLASSHTDKEREEEIFAKMAYFQSSISLLASDYSDFGIKIYHNVKKNSAYLPQSYLADELKGAFNNIPALICGAGPSLAKHLPLLQGLSNRALLFAGGSSLKVLSAHQIVPHFSASLDPNPPYNRFLEQTAFEVPFFYQSRLSSDLLLLAQAPLLWVADNGGYPLERWLVETLLGNQGAFDAGWTVGNLSTALSVLLGCNPIIFVGMDLSCSRDRVYAPGVEEPFQEEKFLLVRDPQGKLLYSRRDWMMSAEWTGEFALKNKERTFINATEGGIGFKGIENLSLEEVVEKHLPRSFDLNAEVHTCLQGLQKIRVSFHKIQDCLQLMDESFVRARTCCAHLLSLFEVSYPQTPFDRGEYLLYEFELEEELVSIKFLEPLWVIWRPVFKRKLEEAFATAFGEKLQKLLFYQRVIQGIIDGKG